MAGKLDGKKIAILVANDGIEQVELTEPRKALEDAGATTELVAPEAGEVQALQPPRQGRHVRTSTRTSTTPSADDYDGLLLPGGVANPATSCAPTRRAVRFVARASSTRGKPVAAICHAPWTLVEAGVVKGRTLTSWPSLQTDIRNAGGTWVDEEVHVDQGLVTSRKPDDIPAFSAKMIEEFGEGAARRPAARERVRDGGARRRA